MAIKKGNDSFSGLVGNAVFYTVKGDSVIRSRPKSRKVVSKNLKEAQGNFSKVMALMKQFKPFIRHGFENMPNNKSAFINAMSENLNRYNEALRLGLTDNLSWLQLSKGKLSKALEATATLNPSGEVTITWNGTESGRQFFSNDHLMVMIYNHRDSSCYINLKQAHRKDEQATVLMQGLMSGDKIDIIIAFSRHEHQDQKSSENVSDSQWVLIMRKRGGE